MNESAIVSLIIGGVSGVATVLVNWIISRGKNKVDSAKADRELLSADEKAFRATIIEELSRVRKMHNECENHTLSLIKQNVEQQQQINDLKEQIAALEHKLTASRPE